MSTLFKGVYYFLAISVAEYTIQGSTLFKGAYYLRKYGNSLSGTLTHGQALYLSGIGLHYFSTGYNCFDGSVGQ